MGEGEIQITSCSRVWDVLVGKPQEGPKGVLQFESGTWVLPRHLRVLGVGTPLGQVSPQSRPGQCQGPGAPAPWRSRWSSGTRGPALRRYPVQSSTKMEPGAGPGASGNIHPTLAPMYGSPSKQMQSIRTHQRATCSTVEMAIDLDPVKAQKHWKADSLRKMTFMGYYRHE